MKRKNARIGLLLCLLATAGISAAVMFADVQAIGPLESTVGLAGINGMVHELTGFNGFWYELTEILGMISLAAVGCFGLIGLIQLISRRSLKKVDTEIWALAAVYLVIGGLYVLFTKVAVNYRPLILDPAVGLEPSFPSSHTMLAVSVLGTAYCAVNKLVKKDLPRMTLRALTLTLLFVIVIGRLLSGVHWVSDIASGILFGLCGIFLYHSICGKKSEKKSAERKETTAQKTDSEPEMTASEATEPAPEATGSAAEATVTEADESCPEEPEIAAESAPAGPAPEIRMPSVKHKRTEDSMLKKTEAFEDREAEEIKAAFDEAVSSAEKIAAGDAEKPEAAVGETADLSELFEEIPTGASAEPVSAPAEDLPEAETGLTEKE